MAEKNKIIPAVYLLLERDNQLLLLRRYNTNFQDGKYTLVSGHVEKGEPPTIAVCREAKEEAGIDVDPKDVKLEQVLYRRGFEETTEGYDHGQPERLDIFFSTDKWKGEPKNMEPDKCDNLRWFPTNRLPKNIFPIAKTFIEEYPNHPPYKEMGY